MRNILRKAGVVLLMAFSQVASAQDYPAAKPINLVIGFGAGGPTDMVGRFVARELEKKLGQKVVVENRPGANGLVALQYVKRAKPDGYTMLLGSALAVASEKPAEFVPGVPTTIESAGIPDFVVGPWNGVLVPAGTSPAIVDRLNAAVHKVMTTEAGCITLLQLGQYPFIGSSEEFRHSSGLSSCIGMASSAPQASKKSPKRGPGPASRRWQGPATVDRPRRSRPAYSLPAVSSVLYDTVATHPFFIL